MEIVVSSSLSFHVKSSKEDVFEDVLRVPPVKMMKMAVFAKELNTIIKEQMIFRSPADDLLLLPPLLLLLLLLLLPWKLRLV
jgi:hypothetical protein